ncbi:MAG: cytidylate kinase family protein [bacterium]|nr:cytidylate kinase family protein [bacterium]
MIITISGLPGSGKSTIGKMLADHFGYKRYSIGDLRGKMAMDRGMTIEELNELGEKEAWTDKEADEYQIELAKKEDNFVIDGRVSYYFIPQSFKIFLDVNLDEAARRVFSNPRPDEKPVDTIEELKRAMAARLESDARRYKQYYGITYPDKRAFDIVIDTSNLSPEQILDRIINAMVVWKPKS